MGIQRTLSNKEKELFESYRTEARQITTEEDYIEGVDYVWSKLRKWFLRGRGRGTDREPGIILHSIKVSCRGKFETYPAMLWSKLSHGTFRGSVDDKQIIDYENTTRLAMSRDSLRWERACEKQIQGKAYESLQNKALQKLLILEGLHRGAGSFVLEILIKTSVSVRKDYAIRGSINLLWHHRCR